MSSTSTPDLTKASYEPMKTIPAGVFAKATGHSMGRLQQKARRNETVAGVELRTQGNFQDGRLVSVEVPPDHDALPEPKREPQDEASEDEEEEKIARPFDPEESGDGTLLEWLRCKIRGHRFVSVPAPFLEEALFPESSLHVCIDCHTFDALAKTELDTKKILPLSRS